MILLTGGDSWTQGDNPSQKLNWEAKKNLDWYDIVPYFGNPLHSPTNIVDDRGYEDTKLLYKFYDSEVWPKVLGRNLNLQTWNSGRLGADNRKICETTIYSIKYLQDLGHSDIFVVVGWSSMFRQKIFIRKDKKFIHTDTMRPLSMNKDMIIKDNIFTSHFLHDILYLQSFLENNNIKYLFFNAFDYVLPKEDKAADYINLNNWVHNSLEEGHMKEYLLKKYNLETWGDGKIFVGCHPSDVGHIDWGNYLTEYIKSNNVV